MVDAQLLELDNVTKRFSAGGFIKKKYVTAVEDVSFGMPEDRPSILTIAGESGSGKTTLAKLILGLLTPTYGEISYKGKSIHRMKRDDWKAYRREVQAVFQDPYSIYNPFYRIDRVLQIPVRRFDLTPSSEEENELIIKSMEAVGLRPSDILGRYPHQLSGGERQRLMLARLLAIKPKLIVADEPISMIDVSLRAMFLNTLLEFNEQYGMSCLFITHNLTNAYYLGGDIIILCRGRAIEKGDMDSIVKKPLHPYTKVLISAIPHTTPKERWTDRLELEVTGITEPEEAIRGCVFHERCPSATPKCRKQKPALVEAEKNHYVACNLYG